MDNPFKKLFRGEAKLVLETFPSVETEDRDKLMTELAELRARLLQLESQRGEGGYSSTIEAQEIGSLQDRIEGLERKLNPVTEEKLDSSAVISSEAVRDEQSEDELRKLTERLRGSGK